MENEQEHVRGEQRIEFRPFGETLSGRTLAKILVVVYVAFVLGVILTANLGPKVYSMAGGEWIAKCPRNESDAKGTTIDCTECTSSKFGTRLTRMSHAHQSLSVSMNYVLPAYTKIIKPVEVEQVVSIEAFGIVPNGQEEQLLHARDHRRRSTCFPPKTEGDRATCSPFTLFTEEMLGFEEYRLRITLNDTTEYDDGIRYLLAENASLMCNAKFCGTGSNQAQASNEPDVIHGWMVDVKLSFVSREFTKFELLFKYVLTVACTMIGTSLIVKVSHYSRAPSDVNSCPRFPKRRACLIFTLLFLFDDPILGLQILHPSEAHVIGYAMCVTTFFAALALYIASLLERVALRAKREMEHKMATQAGTNIPVSTRSGSFLVNLAIALRPSHLLQMLIVVALWACLSLIFVRARIYQYRDPSFTMRDDLPYFDTLVICCAALLSLYLLSMYTYIISIVHQFHLLPALERALFLASTTVLVHLGITLVWAFSRDLDSAIVFFVYGTCNLYVWITLALIVPVPVRNTSGKNCHQIELQNQV